MIVYRHFFTHDFILAEGTPAASPLACHDVQREVRRLSHVGFAAVGPGVVPGHVGDDERTAEVVLHDLEWASGGVVDHAAVVEPEDVDGRFGGLFHGAVEPQTHARLHVHLGGALDHGAGLCKGAGAVRGGGTAAEEGGRRRLKGKIEKEANK